MAAATKDAVLGSAVDLAREVAIELAGNPEDVGEHLGVVVEGERLISHRFASLARGYRGWEWTVTVSRVPRGRIATVCEAELLPGDDAILGTQWVPWSERLRPGDVGPGDVLPFRADDPRLEPGWTPTGDPELDEVAIDELALARVRVLSPQGRDEAAERWFRGSQGPTSPGSLASSAACQTCGFIVPLQGPLGQVFGVCANEWSPDDGKVVALEHGCGAHSETGNEPVPTEWPAPAPLIDELRIDVIPALSSEPGAAEPTEVPVESVDEAAAEPATQVPAEPSDEVAAEPVTEDASVDAPVTETTDEAPADAPVAEPEP